MTTWPYHPVWPRCLVPCLGTGVGGESNVVDLLHPVRMVSLRCSQEELSSALHRITREIATTILAAPFAAARLVDAGVAVPAVLHETVSSIAVARVFNGSLCDTAVDR